MTLRFGEFVLDEGQRRLLRGQVPVHLEPKAFELLLLLARHRPRALAKQEIHEALWPATHVSESSLAGLVLDLRNAFGDDVPCIRTVRGFGYAFNEAAEVVTDDPSPSRWAAVWRNREFLLPEGSHLIGRAEECLIRMDSVRVSRRHARIVVTPDAVSIEDLGSRNGTWFGGRRITGSVTLRCPAEVCVGAGETIRLHPAGPEAPTLTDAAPPTPV
jgi:DNA-binding winged helix-turn-helix (wHTH) protein